MVRKADIFSIIPALKFFRLEIFFHQLLYLDHVMLSSLVNRRNKRSCSRSFGLCVPVRWRAC